MMPGHPVADHRGELAELEIDEAVGPRGVAERVFVDPRAQLPLARIESAIHPGLDENINLRAELRIEEKRQPRVQERVTVRVDEAGHRLLKTVTLQIEGAAQVCAHPVMIGRPRQRVVQPVYKIIRGERRSDSGGQTAADDDNLLHTDPETVVDAAGRKRASNSVQSASERIRRNSPRCRRTSSRARFRPSPCPARFSPTAPR